MAEIFQDYDILTDFLDLKENTKLMEYNERHIDRPYLTHKFKIERDEKTYEIIREDETEYKIKQELASQVLKNYYSRAEIGKFLENCWVGDEKDEQIIKSVHKYLRKLSFNKIMNLIKGMDIDARHLEFDEDTNSNIKWNYSDRLHYECVHVFSSLVENLKNELGQLIESETHGLLSEYESMKTKDVNKIVSSYLTKNEMMIKGVDNNMGVNMKELIREEEDE